MGRWGLLKQGTRRPQVSLPSLLRRPSSVCKATNPNRAASARRQETPDLSAFFPLQAAIHLESRHQRPHWHLTTARAGRPGHVNRFPGRLLAEDKDQIRRCQFAMPVETLQASRAMGTMSATAVPFTSAMPFRILNKGPEYFRRPPVSSGGASRKLSAVERLEADKAKYVKSQQVATTRQDPIRPLLLKQPLFTPGVRRAMFTPNRKIPQAARRGEGVGSKSSLNLEILNNLINFCDSPLTFPKPDMNPSERPWVSEARSQNLDSLPSTPKKKATADVSKLSQSSASSKPSSTVAVRRVDVRPCGVSHARGTPTIQLSPALPAPPKNLPTTPLSCPSPRGEPRTESAKRQTLLHRSKSDLSDRYSRATADLERFFNYCGLAPEDIGDMEMERFTRASSDIVSVKFHSVSTNSSAGTHSRRSTFTLEDRQAERMPYGISIIERNARVIKWLYGLRQAKEAQKISNV